MTSPPTDDHRDQTFPASANITRVELKDVMLPRIKREIYLIAVVTTDDGQSIRTTSSIMKGISSKRPWTGAETLFPETDLSSVHMVSGIVEVWESDRNHRNLGERLKVVEKKVLSSSAAKKLASAANITSIRSALSGIMKVAGELLTRAKDDKLSDHTFHLDVNHIGRGQIYTLRSEKVDVEVSII